MTIGERPVHNLYLTVAVETGLVGLLIFLIFIFYIIIRNSKFLIPKSETGIFLLMFLSLLLFGFFDHFLWTLRPGLLMFWSLVGLLLVKRSQA